MLLAGIQRLTANEAFQSLLLMQIRGTSLVVKFALTLFITKFLGFEALGQYGLIAAASVMAPSILGLALMFTLTRKAVSQTTEEVVRGLHYYGAYSALLFAVLSLAAVAAGLYTGEWLLVGAVFVVVFLEYLNIDLYGLLLNLSRPMLANVLHFVRTALWMVVFMGLAFFYPSLRTIEFLLLGWIAGSALSLAAFFWHTRDWPWRRPESMLPLGTWLRTEFRESAPMYKTGLATSASHYANHFIVTAFLGIEMTGVYVYFIQVISALSNLLQTGVLQVARPKMVRAAKADGAELRPLYLRTMRNAVMVAIAMAAVTGPAFYLVTHALDRPLALEWFPILWVLLVVFVLGVVSETNRLVFYSTHEDRLVFRLSLASIIIGLAANICFIYTLGLWGAALAPLFMSLLFMPVSFFFVVKSLNRRSLKRRS